VERDRDEVEVESLLLFLWEGEKGRKETTLTGIARWTPVRVCRLLKSNFLTRKPLSEGVVVDSRSHHPNIQNSRLCIDPSRFPQPLTLLRLCSIYSFRVKLSLESIPTFSRSEMMEQTRVVNSSREQFDLLGDQLFENE
jgi:hypothetical protein